LIEENSTVQCVQQETLNQTNRMLQVVFQVIVPLCGTNTTFQESLLPRYRTEKWEHRIIAFLRAQGHSGAEIAKITGYASGSIYQILQLPWVKDVIAEEIARSGREGVQTMLQVEAKENVEFLVTIRNDTKQQTRDRITAAKELLDRTYGKPNQPITHREEVDPTSLTDAEIVNLIHAGGRSN
jgi:lambda repressor-like predicted transcriptional regulator